MPRRRARLAGQRSGCTPQASATFGRDAIEDGAKDVYASAASAWEIAIKQSLGKLDLDRPAERWLSRVLERTGIEALPVELGAALRLRALPWHHRDPFDRLLVAHALESGLTIATRDPRFAKYGVAVIPG
jgi:PIN domain nuclease of toxin-antitoxin system